MPRQLRCCYREGSRQCPSPGEGNPPLCRPHTIAVAEASRVRRPGEIIGDVLLSWMHGTPIDIRAAAEELAAHFGGEVPGHVPHQRQRRAPPAPSAAKTRDAELAARRVLGFAESHVPTKSEIKDRRKALSRRYHPDRAGGSTEKMAAINHAADVLLAARTASGAGVR